MRHGTTIWNEKGITQGRSNNHLSKSGIELAKQTALEIKDVNFDAIFCSPLFRTVQTANIVNKFHNNKIIKDEKLIEIDQGIFTGRKYTSLTEEEKQLKKSKSKKCGMESYEEVYLRTKEFIDNLKIKNYNNVLIVTHNCNASIFEIILTNKDISKCESVDFKLFKNAQVKKFVL